MNYTPNHRLPQWASSDRVRMEDFNSAMSSIEAGLTSASADASAAAAAASAAYSPDNKPFVIGSYTGNGDKQKIDLPFKPSLVIISGMTDSSDADSVEHAKYFAITGDNYNVSTRVQLFGGCFWVFAPDNNGHRSPNLNEPGRLYDYIVFR